MKEKIIEKFREQFGSYNGHGTKYLYSGIEQKEMVDFLSSAIDQALQEQRETFLNQKANQHDEEVRRLLREEILKRLPEEKKIDDEYTSDEIPLVVEIMGTTDTPEYLRERRYGYNLCLSDVKEIGRASCRERV